MNFGMRELPSIHYEFQSKSYLTPERRLRHLLEIVIKLYIVRNSPTVSLQAY
jgi:hypothetical protein